MTLSLQPIAPNVWLHRGVNGLGLFVRGRAKAPSGKLQEVKRCIQAKPTVKAVKEAQQWLEAQQTAIRDGRKFERTTQATAA